MEFVECGGRVGQSAPTDEQRAAVSALGQKARPEGRKTQHARAAHPLARDEQRPEGAHLRSTQRERHLAHCHSREGGERRCVEPQAEERGAGRGDVVPQGAPRGEGLGARQTAARHGHLGEGRRIDGRAVPIDEEKRAVGLPFDVLHVDPRAQFHAEALQLCEQCVDHGV